jgi:hypothetical protein
MSIEWKRVTWYSQVIAIILFVAVFALGVDLGEKREAATLSTPIHF